MPFAFPSHQGLIAPMWRRWPEQFDILALCVGAAMPDVVDGLIGAFRGHLGQTVGHSLLGLALFSVPGGLCVWYVLRAGIARLKEPASPGFWHRAYTGLTRSAPKETRAFRLCASLALGYFSHLFFDLISHGGFRWFYPWYMPGRIFPDWWYTTWYELPLPGYQHPYTVGPHLMVWTFLGVLGIVLYCWPLFRPK